MSVFARRITGVVADRRARRRSSCSASRARRTRSPTATPTTRCSTPRTGSARSTATCASPASRSARSARSSGAATTCASSSMLDEDVTLHRDARAAMRPHTLFEGSNFVDLAPGQPERAGDRRGRDDPARADDATTSRSTRRCASCARTSAATCARSRASARGTLRGEAIDGLQQHAAQRAARSSRDLGARRARGAGHAPARARRRGAAGCRAPSTRSSASAGELGPLVARTRPHRRGADGRRRRAARRDARRAARHAARAARVRRPRSPAVVARAGRLADELTPGAARRWPPRCARARRSLRRTIPVARAGDAAGPRRAADRLAAGRSRARRSSRCSS